MARTPQFQPLNPLTLVSIGVASVALGLSVQFIVSSRGHSPLVPPYSMSVTLVMLAALLIILGLRLKRNVEKGSGAVNPFQAVRLLATSRAGQIVGVLFAGLGTGMLMSLAWRSVPAPIPIWLPMLATAVGGTALLVCAIISERMCKVPPGDDTEEGEEPDGVARLEG